MCVQLPVSDLSIYYRDSTNTVMSIFAELNNSVTEHVQYTEREILHYSWKAGS